MQDNNENNNVNMVTESVQETVNQNVESVPVNTVEESNVSKKKNNKKIIIMIAIIILVVVIGVLAFFIFTKDDKSNKPIDNNQANSTNNNSNEENDNKLDDDKKDSSDILANVKFIELNDNGEIKDKKYYIYRTNDGSIRQYAILPESNNDPGENYKLSGTYSCSDNCILKQDYFIHEDKSMEYFDYKTGKVLKLNFLKKYETVDKDLVIEKYSAGKDLIFYSKYKDSTAFGVVENNTIYLEFDSLNLMITSSVDLIEKGTYMLSTYDEDTNLMEYEIFTSTLNKLGYNNETIEIFLGSVSLNYNNNNYTIICDALDCDYIVILNSKMKKIVSYYNYISDCVLNKGEYYCYLNDFDDDSTTSKLAKYDQNGKETIVRKYKTIINLNKDLIVMGLTNDNYYEIYDVKNDKVLYSFDKLTSSQKQCYCSFFDNFNYFDEKTNTFHAFVDDESLTEKDFPNENHDPEKDNYVNMFGYEYTYNVKTGEGKVTKKATYTQQE